MTSELITRQVEVGVFLPPDEVLENARRAATALASVISQKKKPVIMNGEQYLEFDDWQLAGQFYGYTVRTGDAVPVEIDGVKGAKARADLIDKVTGLSLGGAEAYCMRDEEHWNTRPKYEWQGEGNNRHRVKVGDEIVPWFQLASMAQTRAGAKALRNRLAWVVVLAGYKATPAEEMTEGTVSPAVKERRTTESNEHWCAEHHTAFFKRGNMKGYAHKMPDGSWHNEPEPPHVVPQPAPSPVIIEPRIETPPPASTQSEGKAGQENGTALFEETTFANGINWDYLRGAFNLLQWNQGDVKKYLAETYGLTEQKRGELARVMIEHLTRQQGEEFIEEVQRRLEKVGG